MKVTTERLATQEEERAIQQANDILASVNLELIGTRPKDRK
jgi:hypothetical protein